MQNSKNILNTGKLLLLNINRSFSKNSGCSSPLKILVSFDGCVAASEAHFLQEYRRRFPHEPYVRVEERDGIPLAHQYGRLRPDLVNNVETILKSSGFFVKMAPITGAIEALKEMQNSEELDVYLYVCPSQNSPKALHEKFQWIQKHLGQVFVERLIVAKDHAMLKADLHIDWKETSDGNGQTPLWKYYMFEGREMAGSSSSAISWTDNTWREAIARRLNRANEQDDEDADTSQAISHSTSS